VEVGVVLELECGKEVIVSDGFGYTLKMSGIEKRSNESILKRFWSYCNYLQISESDCESGKSIAVVGAGDNVFAAGVRLVTDGKGAFVVGVDPKTNPERVVDPQWINHNGNDIGLPDNSFDMAVSFHGVWKYTMARLMQKKQREEWIAQQHSNGGGYNYDLAMNDANISEAFKELVSIFSEMLRIVKPEGVVKLYPVRLGVGKMEGHVYNRLLEGVIIELRKKYPDVNGELVRIPKKASSDSDMFEDMLLELRKK
jgi:hypothetical protein